MKRFRILPLTECQCNASVQLGPHQAMVRPSEGHDDHCESALLKLEQQADVRWMRTAVGRRD